MAFGVDIFAMAAISLLATQAIRLTAEFFRLSSFVLGRQIVEIAVRVSIVTVILLYLPVCWALTSRSISKTLLGLRIVCADGVEFGLARSVVRFAGYWLSAIPLGLGFLAAIVDRKRRTFHDRIAGTLVVYDERR